MLEALNEMCMSARNIDLAYLIHKLQVSTPFESENIQGGGGDKRNELGERFGDNARAIDERKFPAALTAFRHATIDPPCSKSSCLSRSQAIDS
jgi:hypothetical protein